MSRNVETGLNMSLIPAGMHQEPQLLPHAATFPFNPTPSSTAMVILPFYHQLQMGTSRNVETHSNMSLVPAGMRQEPQHLPDAATFPFYPTPSPSAMLPLPSYHQPQMVSAGGAGIDKSGAISNALRSLDLVPASTGQEAHTLNTPVGSHSIDGTTKLVEYGDLNEALAGWKLSQECPPYNTDTLCCMALLQSEGRRLNVAQIRQWIMSILPYHATTRGDIIKNRIMRQTENRKYMKIQTPPTRHQIWALRPECEDEALSPVRTQVRSSVPQLQVRRPPSTPSQAISESEAKPKEMPHKASEHPQRRVRSTLRFARLRAIPGQARSESRAKLKQEAPHKAWRHPRRRVRSILSFSRLRCHTSLR